MMFPKLTMALPKSELVWMSAPHTPRPGVGVLRYTLCADVCNYTLWYDDKLETRYMPEAHKPPWLETVVNVAKLGGYMKYTDAHPPTSYFWCEVDAGREILQFIDTSKPHVS